MSISYSFDIYLNASFNRANIEKIVWRGKSLGFKYFDGFWDHEIFDLEKIVEKILYIHANREIVDYSHIEVNCEDTSMFFFFLVNSDGFLCVEMSPPKGAEWRTEDKSEIDEKKYKQLLCDLVKDFEVINLTFAESY